LKAREREDCERSSELKPEKILTKRITRTEPKKRQRSNYRDSFLGLKTKFNERRKCPKEL
jgi:hypothetical protein